MERKSGYSLRHAFRVSRDRQKAIKTCILIHIHVFIARFDWLVVCIFILYKEKR